MVIQDIILKEKSGIFQLSINRRLKDSSKTELRTEKILIEKNI